MPSLFHNNKKKKKKCIGSQHIDGMCKMIYETLLSKHDDLIYEYCAFGKFKKINFLHKNSKLQELCAKHYQDITSFLNTLSESIHSIPCSKVQKLT